LQLNNFVPKQHNFARTTPCSLQMLMRRPWGGRLCGSAAENVAAGAKKKKKSRIGREREEPSVAPAKRKGYPQTMLEF
jgi:hypothetical protein